jgi:transcriptional regulator NrdR family protein
MKCPACKSDDSSVIDTRKFDDCIRRVRECNSCKKLTITWEVEENSIISAEKLPISALFPI